jgi:hypothetical protein
MRITYPFVLVAFLVMGTSLPRTEQPAAPSQSPRGPFRTGVDLVHLDVSVLDGNDQPVNQTFAALASDRSMLEAGSRFAEARQSQDDLKILAENTGGRAFSDTNEPEAYVSTIYRLNSAYYLLGFSRRIREPTDGSARSTWK